MMDMRIGGTGPGPAAAAAAAPEPAAASAAAVAQNTASQQIQADMQSLATGSSFSIMA